MKEHQCYIGNSNAMPARLEEICMLPALAIVSEQVTILENAQFNDVGIAISFDAIKQALIRQDEVSRKAANVIAQLSERISNRQQELQALLQQTQQSPHISQSRKKEIPNMRAKCGQDPICL